MTLTKSDPGVPLIAASSSRLPPRPRSFWVRNSSLCFAAGLGTAGVASLTGHQGLVVPSLVLGVLVGVGTAVQGLRAAARAELVDEVIYKLREHLGWRKASRSQVRVWWWRRGWPGFPRRVRVRHAPGVEADSVWLADLTQTLRRQFGVPYEVVPPRTRIFRHRIVRLRWVPQTDADKASPAALDRAERLISDLMGPTAKVVDAGWQDGQLASLEVTHRSPARLEAAGYQRRVNRVVSASLPGRWRASWDTEQDKVRLEVRPTLPENLWLPTSKVDPKADVLASYKDVKIPFGVDEDGHEMVWRPARQPHTLLIGQTGRGKTVTAHTLLVQASRYGWPIWVVDGKRVEFLGFRDWPNVQIVATQPAEQVAVVHMAVEIMERRYQLIEERGYRESDFEPLLVFIDEWADLRANIMGWYSGVKIQGEPKLPPILDKAASLARKSRLSRVHLIFGTQRNDAQYFGGDFRDNFGELISVGPLSPQAAVMMWKNPAVGVALPDIPGRGMAAQGSSHLPVEMQAYHTPDPRKTDPGSTEAKVLDRLRPDTSLHERLVIVPPEDRWDEKNEKEAPPLYNDYAYTRWAKAADRRDLDPLANKPPDPELGRELARPTVILGLSGRSRPTADRRLAAIAPPPPDTSPAEVAASDAGGLDDLERYYAEPEPTPPGQLEVGDLVLIDEDADEWGVVEEPPDSEYADGDCVEIYYRRHSDGEEGYLSVPADEYLSIRHPLEEEIAV